MEYETTFCALCGEVVSYGQETVRVNRMLAHAACDMDEVEESECDDSMDGDHASALESVYGPDNDDVSDCWDDQFSIENE